MNNTNKVTIYTDGGCRGNGKANNIGAYAFVIDFNNTNPHDAIIERAFSFDNTTNNQMELLAVIKALDEVSNDSVVTVHSDSKYVCDAVNNGWIDNWCKNGWKTAKKEPVKNQDLWLMLIQHINRLHLSMKWVKGHSTNELNNRCDDLLNQAMDNHIPNTSLAVPSFNSNSSMSIDDVKLKLVAMRNELDSIINSL